MTQEIPEQPKAYHYARGTYRRLAEEEHGQERRRELQDYRQGPSPDDVVDDMVGNGWEERESREAARALWEDLDA